ncbi:hypothetical protein GO013_16290 [Pseudodesulfovibrio sp. JC047]|uniref:DsbA family protein n=1 Tax=Pseudodesulfovibrio sp. JC047 TaxID=2683199 RepID=UPI0013D48E91|nr:hypothetical protein [Pseudodesulfovibrio sp. JC047]NDV20972.1 hypothetical protein [Pseudodesulfovibrio sp. JC047]
MQRYIPCLLFVLALSLPVAALAGERNGCAPEYRALYKNAVVALQGTGDGDVVVVTDPLCWHCRLGHKLLGEYPELYRTVRLSFFPRLSYPGSDMAAWILEDAVGTDQLKAMVDFAYTDLKRIKTDDLIKARLMILMQFTEAFPHLLDGTTEAKLAVRLQKEHELHTMLTADLAKAADLPGTPILVAGKTVLVGFGPGPWLDALKALAVCP